MSAMSDYLLEIEEEIKKWYPFLSWETIEELTYEGIWKKGFIWKEAKKAVDKGRGYEKN